MLENRSDVGWVRRTSETRRLLFLLLLFYCKGLHDVLLNRGQVLCSQSGSLFNCCIKKKKKRGLELCDRAGNEQPSLHCNKHTTQTCHRSVLSAQCLFTRGNPEIQRSQMDYSGCVVAHKLEKALRFFNRGNLIKQKSVPPPTETQCLSCCLQSPANCNTTSLLLALLGHACH